MTDFIDLSKTRGNGDQDPTFKVVDRFFEHQENMTSQTIALFTLLVDKAELFGKEMLELQKQRLEALNKPSLNMNEILGALSNIQGAQQASTPAVDQNVIASLNALTSQVATLQQAVVLLKERFDFSENKVIIEKNQENHEVEDDIPLYKNTGHWQGWNTKDSEGAEKNSSADYLNNYRRFKSKINKS